MPWEIAAVAIIGSFIVAILLGIPVAVSLGVVAIIFIWAAAGPAGVASVIGAEYMGFWSGYTLLALPLFIVMGEFIVMGGVAEQLFDVAAKWLQRIPGGLSIVAIGTGAMFGSISGSTLAGIATIGVLTGPQMLKRGYAKYLCSASILSGGTLAHLIPPSIMAVLYAGLVEISVGRQLLAGMIPGLTMASLSALTIVIWVRLRPNAAPVEPPVSWRVRVTSLKKLVLPLSTAIVVLGVIYTGVATATEAAGIGALMAIAISIASKKIGIKTVWETGAVAARTTAFILLIAVGGKLLGWALQYYLIPQNVVTALTALHVSPYVLVGLVLFVIFLLGFVMDSVSIMVITIPILIPIFSAMKIDPMVFGVVMLIVMELGLITPPVALGTFLLTGILAPHITMGDVLRGFLLFFIPHIVLLVLLIAFPIIVHWLPDMMIAPT